MLCGRWAGTEPTIVPCSRRRPRRPRNKLRAMYEHLLVALDGSPHAERVLEHTEALAKAFGSTVTLLRATVSAETLLVQTAGAGQTIGDVAPVMDPTPILEADRDAAVEYLEPVAARLRQHNLTVFIETP